MTFINKILYLVFIFPLATFGQNTIGLPEITNYNKYTYKAGLQNWDIRQDATGIMYFANNEGVLSFDGKFWKKYPLPNQTIVRSLEIGADGFLYAGGQDEIGYFYPNQHGKLIFQSILSFLPEKDRSFGDVWDIVTYNKEVFFRTNSKIIRFNGKNAMVYPAVNEWTFLGVCQDKLYAHDFVNGLLVFRNESWQPACPNNKINENDPVTGITFNGSQILVSTLKSGVFSLNSSSLSPLSNGLLNSIASQRIYHATSLLGGNLVFGTSNAGLFITDSTGKLIQQFSKKEGLQQNNVLCIFSDKQQNLWVGLDNGIACIAYNSAIKHISPTDQENAGYAAALHQEKLYIGTSGGVYSTPVSKATDISFNTATFDEVKNTAGQTWNLTEINGRLLMGHHEGAFEIENNMALPIASGVGYWNFIPTSSIFPAKTIIAGNYKGLKTIRFDGSQFTANIDIDGFDESSRFVAVDEKQDYWVSHPYHGIYRLFKKSDSSYGAQSYDVKKGLPQLLNNHIYKIKNRILAATENGVYAYRSDKDLFEPETEINKLLGNISVRVMKEDSEGNIWFIHEKCPGVIDYSEAKARVIYVTELNNKMVSGFECIYAVDKNNIFLGSEKGFYHLNYDKYRKNRQPLVVHISSVSIHNQRDSVLFDGHYSSLTTKQTQPDSAVFSIPYSWNSIVFSFAAMQFQNSENIEYAFRLKGENASWSEWTSKTEKEFSNLAPGSYVFEVKARNNLGGESAPVSYSFTIMTPWYRSTPIYLVYFLSVLGLMYLIYYRQRKKLKLQQIAHEEEQKRIQYLHQLEMNKTESELISLRNEKLQGEVDFKNSELAMSAMHLVQKGELMTKLKNELNSILKSVENEKTVAEIKKLIKVLGEDNRMDQDWEHFAQHFDKVHSDFLTALKEKHENLTPNELKLSTYLRMNLSSKEIAQLMNVSLRGVEISRYRLRKKLGIATEISLFDYLMGISVAQKNEQG